MSRPLVSIIIPVFNAEKHLRETICSALDQTWTNTEIIIIDDGSTDQSLSIAKEFESKQVKVIAKKNQGASSARNTGIGVSQGAFLQFLDADDILSTDKVENQVTALQSREDYVALCSTVHFNDGEDYKTQKPSDYEERFIDSSEDQVNFLIRLLGGYNFEGSMVQPNAWLTPKNLILKSGLWNEGLTIDDDGEFFSRIILNSKGIVKTQGLNFYRKFKTNKNLSKMLNEHSYRSAFNSILLKKGHLLTKTNQTEAYAAIFYQLKSLQMVSYPRHPALTREITQELKLLPSFKYQPVFQNYIAKLVYKIMGWKCLKLLQYLKSNHL